MPDYPPGLAWRVVPPGWVSPRRVVSTPGMAFSIRVRAGRAVKAGPGARCLAWRPGSDVAALRAKGAHFTAMEADR